ncbi:hypothetical protein H257_19481 [Aphanomyces astaci]|uniref:Uncharacterized protein n=1 Tax=Aphanomyces astaci TaxID=112090 RepID=W4F9V9_APHAT|nr:hypothetical protein H257_19481 [Aphanomyces astaci]ETV63591.1 hypothetical protein H257_19481 [Aphanomyces astaci]|eukprot:XP_009846925.1 hypothetical protein H257_19481 [Aphanomyces astaci]
MVDGCGVVVWYTYFKVHMTKEGPPEIPQHRNIRKQHEGLRGFYKGLTPNLIKVLPTGALIFAVYEYQP